MITLGQHEYGDAATIAAQLGPDVTAARVRDWGRRGLVTRYRDPGRRRTWYRLDEAAEVERRTRCSTRGRKRLDVTATAA